MKILYITAELPYSTQEAFVIPEIKETLRRGHEVLIVPRSPRSRLAHRDAQPLIDRSIRVSLFAPKVLAAAALESVIHPFATLRALSLLLKGRSPGILARNLATFPKSLWLARLARRWRPDHIHAHWAATTSTMALVVSELTSIPWSFTAHRWDIVENNLLDLKVRRATMARFISASGLRLAVERGVTPDEGKSQVLHMGIDLPDQPAPPSASSDPVAICPANLVRVKGHRYLIEAFSVLRERGCPLELRIAGDGELRAELEQLVESRGLGDRVSFLGQVSHDALLGMYSRGDVQMVVLPSIDAGNGEHEGIPVALIEGMGYGLPVVSTETGGIPELLHDGAGVMVRPADPVGLADALERLHDEPDRRRELAAAGRKRAVEQFSIQVVMGQLLKQFASQGAAQ